MAAYESFLTSNNDVLQQFLKVRGITVSNIKKKCLIELCCAVSNLNLPINPDFQGISAKESVRVKLEKLGIIADPLHLAGFSNDLSNIPNFTLFDVFNYLLCSRAEYDKRKLKAYKSCDDYRLFFDGHVEKLEFNSLKDSRFSLFRAKVRPTQRASVGLYDLWICLGKEHGDVAVAYCTCIGGADGACRHIGAVLYEIEAFEPKSCTDGENQWKKRPMQHDCPVPIKRLKVVKAKYVSVTEIPSTKSQLESFDPRANTDEPDDKKLNDLCDSLKKISPNIQVLDVLDTKFGEKQQSSELDEKCGQFSMTTLCNKYVNEMSNVTSDSISDENVPTALSEKIIENLSDNISPDDILYVESTTQGQSANPNWSNMRKGRVTASNFSKVCSTVDMNRNPESLQKLLMGEYGSNVEAAPLLWGRKKEKCALDLYKRVMLKKHKIFRLEKRGFRIYTDMPFIGCSVDSLSFCKCCHKSSKIVEVKCPYSLRNKLPKKVALCKGCVLVNGSYKLTPKSEYYHQIQGQMGIYGYTSADLVLYTKHGIHVVEDIEFDADFFADMVEKLKFYFKTYLLKRLIFSQQ